LIIPNPKNMVNYPKFVLSCPTLENLLESIDSSYPR
jgi:hypothetical protein